MLGHSDADYINVYLGDVDLLSENRLFISLSI